MFHQHPTFANAFCPGGLYEILVDHIKGGGAHVAAPDRNIDQCKHNAGEDEVVQIIKQRSVTDRVHISRRQPSKFE